MLGDALSSIERFVDQGIAELGGGLGPILWQFMPTKKFDRTDFAAFLALLPRAVDGLTLRHAVEVRHESFMVPDFIALLRDHNVALVCADHAEYPMIADVTADFAYVRLQTGRDDVATCYEEERLDLWAERLRSLAAGGVAGDLPLLADPLKTAPRDVFAFFITEGKVNAPRGRRRCRRGSTSRRATPARHSSRRGKGAIARKRSSAVMPSPARTAASPWRQTALAAASKGGMDCARWAPTRPASTSPVPAVASQGGALLLIATRPSGAAITVSAPFRTMTAFARRAA